MYNRFTLTLKFLRYYLSATNGKGHGIHSPFLFEFVRDVLNKRHDYYSFAAIEAVRKRMLEDQSIIEVEDKGAGSMNRSTSQRSISSIARAALKPPKYAQLLFRMVNFYQPENILELGTSLGITTAYLASAKKNGKVITIEGSSAIACKALENLNRMDLTNIQVVNGDFKDELKPALEALVKVDFAFVDGNHRKDPTLEYFAEILKYSHSHTIIIFDDIHWSEEMEQAWNSIKQHPAVTCTVDLFFLGLVFLRNEFRTPQHFTIRF